MNLEQRVKELEAENKDLQMRLSAIKVIVTKINPVCSEKLQKLLEACEGCQGGNEHTT